MNEVTYAQRLQAIARELDSQPERLRLLVTIGNLAASISTEETWLAMSHRELDLFAAESTRRERLQKLILC